MSARCAEAGVEILRSCNLAGDACHRIVHGPIAIEASRRERRHGQPSDAIRAPGIVRANVNQDLSTAQRDMHLSPAAIEGAIRLRRRKVRLTAFAKATAVKKP